MSDRCRAMCGGKPWYPDTYRCTRRGLPKSDGLCGQHYYMKCTGKDVKLWDDREGSEG